MNIKREILRLNGKKLTIDQVKDLQKKAAGDKLIEMKLTKTISAAASNKLDEFKLILSGEFKKYLQSAQKPVKSINNFDISQLGGIDEVTRAEAQELGIIEGLGRLNHKDIYKAINEQILSLIKQGNLSWRKGWRDGIRIKGKTYGAQNYISQSPYRGFNAFSIAMYNMVNNANYTYFLTLKQIKERGGELKPKAAGIYVAAYIKSEKVTKHPTNPELVNVEIKQGIIPYMVYPLEQTTGVKPIKRKAGDPNDGKDIEDIIVKPQTVIDQMPKAPPIKHGGDRAFYTPSGDYVQMPLKKSFHTLNEYYSTLFHELVHSTGSSKRLDRKFKPFTKFGDKDYAFEELIAELGASYLCGVTGIEYFTLKNSAAYLESWGRRLSVEMKSDKTFFFRAIMAATKAAKYIIGETIIDTHEGGGKGKKKASKPVKNSAKTKPEKHPDQGKNRVSKTPEVKPDKSKKASIQAAIKDVLTISKFKDVTPMLAQMLYSDFKDKRKVEYDELSSMKQAIYNKANEKGFLEYEIESGVHYYYKNQPVEDLIRSINGRLQTLKAKKQGNDMFPELAGVKKAIRKHLVDGKRYSDQELIDYANSVFFYEIQDAEGEEITTVAEAKKMFKAYGDNVKPVKKKAGLGGTMSVSQAANSQFDLLGLDGAYEKMIGEACRPTSFFIYGAGGSGKSTFTLQFAYYLAQKRNKVAYVAGEQYGTPVFSKMLKRLGITDLDTFVIAKDLVSIDPKQYQVIVIDSKDSLGIDHLQFESLQKKYPQLSWAILSQATKDGGFTGSEKWRNLVDTMIYCENGTAKTGTDKNRWGGKGQIRVY